YATRVIASGEITSAIRRTTNGKILAARFLPISTSVACESYSAASRASVLAFCSSLPGRNAIDERLQSSIRRARIRPNEQFVRRRPHRQRPHRQQRPLLLQHRRAQQSADIQVATVDKAAVRECPELPQFSRLQVLPRLLLQRKLSKLCVEFVPRHESFLLCRSNAGTKRRPRDTVTVLLPHWLLRDFQSWGAPIIVDDPSARSPK